MRKTKMGLPAEFSEEAEKLIQKYGYLWDDWSFGLRRTRRVGEETTEEYLQTVRVIPFEKLSDHGLFEPHATSSQKTAALKWLENELKSN